jgi:hypothetical protein
MLVDDLTAVRFDHLRVIKRVENAQDGSAVWECKCDCGESRTIRGTALRAGRHKSCGCMSPKFKANDPRNAGYSHLREYRIWRGMVDRCSDLTGKKSHLYAAKGIRVCERWNTFPDFLADMGKCPKGFTIERIDGNRGYEPSNCKWASRVEQANNTTRNVMLEFKGRRQTISQWATELAIKSNTIVYRIRRGWSIERALSKTN